MGGTHPIRNVLRIDNVETQPAERITANDEERQRQGFDIQTVFAWPLRDGALDVASALASDADGPILSIDYASGATISRLNKGLRRRKEKSIFGFGIDPATGRWTGSPEEGDDDATPEGPVRQRVVPIVQDTKNAALLRLSAGPLPEAAMATLQHALARGIGLVFQLEEGETLTEPVPSRESRRAILAYEATEGGAGVLGRLTTEPQALARVARTALDLMHYRNLDAAIAAADPALLEERPGGAMRQGLLSMPALLLQPAGPRAYRSDGRRCPAHAPALGPQRCCSDRVIEREPARLEPGPRRCRVGACHCRMASR